MISFEVTSVIGYHIIVSCWIINDSEDLRHHKREPVSQFYEICQNWCNGVLDGLQVSLIDPIDVKLLIKALSGW